MSEIGVRGRVRGPVVSTHWAPGRAARCCSRSPAGCARPGRGCRGCCAWWPRPAGGRARGEGSDGQGCPARRCSSSPGPLGLGPTRCDHSPPAGPPAWSARESVSRGSSPAVPACTRCSSCTCAWLGSQWDETLAFTSGLCAMGSLTSDPGL